MKNICNEIFTFLNINNINIQQEILNNFQSKKGPTDSSNWLTKNILIGMLPKTCEDVEKIMKAKISLFISLREYEETYPKCINEKYKKKEIFYRFDIPDFSIRDPESIRALIDNIITYVNINQKNVMIHCLGGHGRTGTVVTPLIAMLVFSKNILDSKSEDYINIRDTKTWLEWDDKIHLVAKNLFIKAQAYVMLSLRAHRKTNGINIKKNIMKIKIPETHAQDDVAIAIIKLYIKDYLKTGNLYYALNL